MSRRDRRGRVDYLTALCRTVPYHIVEAVLRDPSEASVQSLKLDGTLMFADMVGFTPMCERLADAGPEGLSKLGQILNGLFEALLEQAIFPYFGYVVHFGGDSITAVFRDQDHGWRAAASALKALRLMDSKVGQLIGGTGREIMLRIGLCSGEIRLPVLGDAAHRFTLCAGPVAHQALAMQHLAPPNAIMAHESLLRELGDRAQVDDPQPEHAQLRALRTWPDTVEVPGLGDRVLSACEAKITLLEPFVAAPLAGRLMSMPAEWRIEGELRTPVIMFTEIWGLDDGGDNLALAMQLSPLILRAARKYGGIISKADLAPRGHRFMVLFGLHRPSDNDAERAVLSALEATARVRSFTAAKGLDISIRSGIHTGRVYFGAIGSPLKYDVTVVGDAVNTAARAAGAAEPFEVLVTDALLGPIRDEVEHSERAPLLVKGKSAPLRLHVVHSPAPGSTQYVRQRVQPRLLAGRADEVAQLRSAVDDAMAGRGHFIGICGQRGTGKSALLSVAVNHAAERGATGLLSRCRYATRSEPLAPVVAMFATFLGITKRDTEAERRERIRVGLGAFKLSRGAPELVALLSPVRRSDGTAEANIDLADEYSCDRALESIVEFVAQRIAQESLLYVLEDLHLADSMTLQLAMRLARLTGKGAFLFVITYRPEPILAQVRASFSGELVLGDLPSEALAELVCHELRVDGVDPDLLGFLRQRTGGNPGHAVEVVRFLKDRSLVRERAGTAVAAEPGLRVLEDVVPHTLAQVALARLDELSALERRVLRVASAIGRRFDRAVLEGAAPDDVLSETVRQAVETLETQGVIAASAGAQQGFMFRDGVTRAVTYGTIPDPERRRLHQRIADAMEKLVEGGDPSAAMLAMHRERAGQHADAARCYERAAKLALRSGLLREAIELSDGWSRVVGCLPEPERPSDRAQADMALLRLGALARRDLPSETVREARRIVAEFSGVLAEADRARVEYWMSGALGLAGRVEEARDGLAHVVDTATDPSLQADAARLLSRLELRRGQLQAAAQWAARASALEAPEPVSQARTELLRAELDLHGGRVSEAAATALRIGELARAERQAGLLADALTVLGRAWLAGGELLAAREAFVEALDLTRSSGRVHEEATLLCALGQTHLWEGDYEQARRQLERAFALAQEIGDGPGSLSAQVHLSLALALSVDPAGGAALCAQVLNAAAATQATETLAAGRLYELRIALARRDHALVPAAAARLRRPEVLLGWPLYQAERRKLLEEAAGLVFL